MSTSRALLLITLSDHPVISGSSTVKQFHKVQPVRQQTVL